MVSNNFVLPQAGDSIALARVFWNNSFRAVGENFYGFNPPTPGNYVIEGSNTSPVPDGILFREQVSGALYIHDSVHKKVTHLGASWTRVGIGWRVEETLVDVNLANYEIGEGFVTVNANSRLYMKSTNAGAIVDLGLPAPLTVTTAMLQDGSVTSDKLADGAGGDTPQTFVGPFTVEKSSQISVPTSAIIVSGLSGSDALLSFKSSTGTSGSIKLESAGSDIFRVIDRNQALTTLDVGQLHQEGALLVPTGTIVSFGGSSIPSGWVECDRENQLSEVTFARLFAVIGTTFNTGGESVGFFRPPDLIRRFPVGAGGVLGLGSTSDEQVSSTGVEPTKPGGPHTHTFGEVTVASSGKDIGTVMVVQTINAESSHFHDMKVPYVAVKFIIKD